MQPNYDAASSGILAMFGVGFFIFIFAISIFYIICMWKIYEKAGHPGWSAIIPIYSAYILTKIIGKPWWWLLLFCIPLINIIFLIWSVNLLSKSFGKDIGYTLGLLFLGVIFYPLMAFDKSIQYVGPAGSPINLNDQIEGIGGRQTI